METKAKIRCDELTDDELLDLSTELSQMINDETDVTATPEETEATPGARGDGVAIGSLVLSFLSSGTAGSLVGVLKTFFERRPSLVIEVESGDGRRMKIEAGSLRAGQVDQTISMVERFVGETG